MKRGIPSLMVSKSITSIDADAQAFITAAGITDATQKTAINTLVVAAKANGWWTLCSAIYPIVGGNATAHSYNLKNTSLYQITFSSGWTHSATGALPDGSTAYAQTGLIPSSVLSLNDMSVSYYSRTSAQGGTPSYEIGSSNGSEQNILITIRRSGDLSLAAMSDQSTTIIIGSASDGAGFFLASRTSSTAFNYYRNTSSIGSSSATQAGTLPTIEMYLGALNAGSAQGFSNKECAFATIGSGINSTIAALMYTDIQNFQISLSRSV